MTKAKAIKTQDTQFGKNHQCSNKLWIQAISGQLEENIKNHHNIIIQTIAIIFMDANQNSNSQNIFTDNKFIIVTRRKIQSIITQFSSQGNQKLKYIQTAVNSDIQTRRYKNQ